MLWLTALALGLAGLAAAGWGWGLHQARRAAAERQRRAAAESRASAWSQLAASSPGAAWLWLGPDGRTRAAGGNAPAGLGHLPAPANWLSAVAPTGPSDLWHQLSAHTAWLGPFVGRDGRQRCLAARTPAGPADGWAIWAVDLTDRAAAAQQAETALARARTMLAHSAVAVWARDADGRLLDANPPYAELVATRLDAALAQGKEIATTTPGESRQAQARQALRDGATTTAERYVVVEGQRRLLRLTETPLASDAPAGGAALVGHAIDITERAHLAAERDRHIAAHNEVLEQLATAIAIYGPDRRLTFFNSAYARLWGLSPAWLSGQPTMGEVMETQRALGKLPEQPDFQAFKAQREALFRDLLAPHEELLHLPDMTTLRMLITPHPFGGLLATFEDVTDKLALESAFNTLLETQRESLENLVEGIVVIGPDGRIRLTNAAARALLALPGEDQLAQAHYRPLLAGVRDRFARPEAVDGLSAALLASASERTSTDGRLERLDGRQLDYATVPLPDGAGMARLLDVSDTVRIQESLQASERARQEAERLKADLVANISYHLRTPLNALLGHTQMLEAGYGGGLTPTQKTYATRINAGGRALTQLIDTVLDLAAIDAGRLPLRPEPMAPRAVLAAALRSQRARLRGAGLALDTTGAQRNLPALTGDRGRLAQAVARLLENAIQFTPVGGRIALAATTDRLDDGAPAVALTVSDTGMGIPDTGRDVFARFERAHPAHAQAGPGLGLSLARQLVRLHGGQIDVATEVGAGTALTVRLPTESEEAR